MPKFVRKHGSAKGEWGHNSRKEMVGWMWRPATGAPLAPVSDSVNAGGLPALNFLREPCNVGFIRGHYLVQHRSRLRWVHLWRVGKACMSTPQWGNILTLRTPVYNPRHARSYKGDTGTRGTGLSMTWPTRATKTSTSTPSTPVGVAEATELLEVPSATTHFGSAMPALQALDNAAMCEVRAHLVSRLTSRTP